VGLNLKLPLYLGGPDPYDVISSNTGVTQGFVGCVAEVRFFLSLSVNSINANVLGYNVMFSAQI
jgi:hypothetical protein